MDEIIERSNPPSKKKNPKRLRRMAVWDEEKY